MKFGLNTLNARPIEGSIVGHIGRSKTGISEVSVLKGIGQILVTRVVKITMQLLDKRAAFALCRRQACRLLLLS